MRGNTVDPFANLEFAVGIDVRVAIPYEMTETILETTGMNRWDLEASMSHNVTLRPDGASVSALDTIDPMVRWMVGETILRVVRNLERGQREHERASRVANHQDDDAPWDADDTANIGLVLNSADEMVETPIGHAYGDGSDSDI